MGISQTPFSEIKRSYLVQRVTQWWSICLATEDPSWIPGPKEERKGKREGQIDAGQPGVGSTDGQIPLVYLLVHKEFKSNKTVFAYTSFVLNSRLLSEIGHAFVFITSSLEF